MTTPVSPEPQQTVSRADMIEIGRALGGDLELLAILHDREPSPELIAALRECPIDRQFGLELSSSDTQTAVAALRLSIDDLPDPIDQSALDELAAGFADVYLRHTYRASPAESVWLTEDGLERQTPMFVVRETYRRNNLRVDDWASRPDDHLVLQLRFLAHLANRAETAGDFVPVAQFLDQHPLRWINRFAGQLIGAGAPDYFAAIALLTASYLDEMRDYLTDITGHPRPQPAPKAPAETKLPDREEAYFPGVAPSW